ncbi:hypothetical protein [Tsukamurella columbiensis]|uniref:DUF3040 domain-containing protein n=1 Tax=Tsukamurella columbiensis TaxID=128509 RepID=A0ABX1LKS2_9ACTN|nr:hypothetical protein [Tsukamurella columbiensis]NMD58324.1 hypothetical protein [Tsukamurella columbiensis]
MALFGTLLGETTTVRISKLPRSKKALLSDDIGLYFASKRLPRRVATKLIKQENNPNARGRRRWLGLRRGRPLDRRSIDRAWGVLATDPSMLRVLAKHEPNSDLTKALARRSSVRPMLAAMVLVLVGLIVIKFLPMPISGLLALGALVGAFVVATRAQRNDIIELDPSSAAQWVPLVRTVAHKKLGPATGGRG